MPKVRIALTLEEDVWKAVRIRAPRLGLRGSEVVEAALRRHLGLDLLDQIWANNDLSEATALDLAFEAQKAARTNQ